MKAKVTGFLKLIIGYKTVMGLFELLISFYLFNIYRKDPRSVLKTLLTDMGMDLDNILINGAVEKAGLLGAETVFVIISVIFVFGAFNLIEAFGLSLRRKWAEWLTVVATAMLIPFEAYELLKKFSLLTLAVLVINSAIVYYLARHKELFKSKKESKAA